MTSQLINVKLSFDTSVLTLLHDYKGNWNAYYADFLKVNGKTEEDCPLERFKRFVINQADPFRKVPIKVNLFRGLLRPGIECDRNGRKPYEYRLEGWEFNTLMEKFTTPATESKNTGATAADYLMDNNDPTEIQLNAYPETALEDFLIIGISPIKPRGIIPALLEKCRPGGGVVGKEERIRYSTFWDEKKEGGWLYNTGIVTRDLRITPETYKKILIRLSFACGYIPKFLKGYDKSLEVWSTVERAVIEINGRSDNSVHLFILERMKTAEERMEYLRSMALRKSFKLAKFQNTIIASGILGLVNEYRSIEELTEDEDKEIERFWGSFFGKNPRLPSLMTRKVRDESPYVKRCSVSEAIEILSNARRIKGQVIKLVGYKTARMTLKNIDINFLNIHAEKLCAYLPVSQNGTKEKGIIKGLRELQRDFGDFIEIRWSEDPSPLINEFDFVEISDPRAGMDIKFSFGTKRTE